MRRFYVFKRSSGIYHVQYRAPAGFLLAPRSLRTRDPDAAYLKAVEWLQDGIPAPSGERRSVGEDATAAAAFRVIHAAPSLLPTPSASFASSRTAA